MVGIDTYEDGVGYKHIKIQPHIGGGFTNAFASLQTYYGTLSSGWKIEGGKIIVDAEIPANATATIYIPSSDTASVTENGIAISSVKDISVMGSENGYVILQTGSGKYHFEARQ